MSIHDQNELKANAYKEAIRYMCNAKETLKKANKEGKFYQDKKYVQTACGIAYNGVLLALKSFLKIKGIDQKKREVQDIYYFRMKLGKIDQKLLKHVNNVYDILHLSGYYDGNPSVSSTMDGFELAYLIIEKIKPTS